MLWMMPDRSYDLPKLPAWLHVRVVVSNLLAYPAVADSAEAAGEPDQAEAALTSLENSPARCSIVRRHWSPLFTPHYL